jgi:hypothetical protein
MILSKNHPLQQKWTHHTENPGANSDSKIGFFLISMFKFLINIQAPRYPVALQLGNAF